MRIDCEQCGAAYSIDDALITERGVRAQCPKCAHQKVVKKPSGGAAAPSLGGAIGGSAAPGPVTAMMPRVDLPPPSAAAANPFAPPSQPPTPSANPFAATAPNANPFGQPFSTSPTAAQNPGGALAAPFGAEATQPSANPFATTQASPSLSGSGSGNPFAASSMGAPLGGLAPPSMAPTGSPFNAPTPMPPQGNNLGGGGGGAPFGGNPFGAPTPMPPSGPPFGQGGGLGAGGAPPSSAGNPFSSPSFGAPPPAQPQAQQPPPMQNPFASPGPMGASASPFGSADPFSTSSPPPPQQRQAGAMQDPFGALGAAPAPGPPQPAIDPFSKIDAPSFGGGTARPKLNMPAGAPGARAIVVDPTAPSNLKSDPFATPDPSSPHDPFGGQALGGGAKTADDPFAKLDIDNTRGGPGAAAPPTSSPQQRLDGGRAGKAASGKGSERGTSRGSGVGSRNRPSLGVIAAFVAVVVVVGGGAIAFVVKPELFEKNTDAGVNPLRRAKPSWEKQFPEVTGTAQEHISAGRAQMRLDTAAGYRKADDELRQALLLDIGNVNAIGAWVENFTNLPAVKADMEGASLAGEAIGYARKKDNGNVDVMRAEGALKLALGEVDAAQKILVQAHTQAPGNAETTLVLAASHLDRNPSEAFDLVQEVRTKDPALKHALVVEGAAQRRLGAFREARDVLGARLADDPANTGALKEMAKLDLDIGDPEAAIAALSRLLEGEDRDVEAHLMRAKIAYQAVDGPPEAGLKRADGFLDIVLKNHDTSAGELLLPVLTHAAYVKAELGNLDEALRLAERARATQSDYAPALFVLGRVQALKGNLDEAKKRLEDSVRATQARDTFYEPVARAELARILSISGDAPNAIRNYEQVIEYDPRYTRAHYGLAATYINAGKATQAMTIIRRAFENDPGFEADRRILTDYPTPKRDLIAFADAFKNAKVPPGDESLAALKLAAEGMIRYAAGQVAESEALEKRTLVEDHFSDVALLYLGVIELADGRVQEAHKHLRLAVDTTGKNHSMTRLYLARTETKTGDLEVARQQLQDLIDQEPTLVQAQYSQAMLMRQQHLEAQAIDHLKKVIKADPDFQPAKRALAE